jgi:hypothetical protein
VRTHQFTPGSRKRGIYQWTDNPGTIDKREVNPPAEKEEGNGYQWDNHGVLHQSVGMVLVTRGSHLIYTETDVYQKHEHDSYPIVKLGKYDTERRKFVIHYSPRSLKL